MRHRSGWTLIEMVAAITVASTMLALGIALLHLLLRLNQETREDLRQRGAMARLAEQFREDAHATVGQVSNLSHNASSPGPWQLPLAGGRVVEYRQEPERLLRIEQAGKQDQRQESYRLPAGVMVSIEVEEPKSGKIAVLRIAPDEKAIREPNAHPVRIEGAIGLGR